MIQDAVIRNTEIIGEATKGLSQALCDRHTDIPWKQIAGMRDFLIHVSFEVKLEAVWKTIVESLPQLKAAVKSEIDPAEWQHRPKTTCKRSLSEF